MMHLTFIQLLHNLLKENGINPLEWEIRSLQAVDSTNDMVDKLFYYYDHVVVLAQTQEKGRGRNEHTWESPEGGCWLSIGVMKRIPAIELATPVTNTVSHVLNKYIKCSVKKPNDIMIGDKKVAGILVEGKITGKELDQVIIGIGINVTNELSDEISKIATRMKDHCDPPKVEDLAAEVSLEIIKILKNYGFD
ncbi:MAG: biotin--[acetyl-CoA-carboxylase] ligase [Candidatus Kariarchaeaceae archaeon]|jgi:BirA family biotin operon repressor/biotin-[acetyl-CoA-carboxylase] ligase